MPERPALENGWHGGPPAMTSMLTARRIRPDLVHSRGVTEVPVDRHAGEVVCVRLQCVSDRSRHRRRPSCPPASSPRLMPPAPEKRSAASSGRGEVARRLTSQSDQLFYVLTVISVSWQPQRLAALESRACWQIEGRHRHQPYGLLADTSAARRHACFAESSSSRDWS